MMAWANTHPGVVTAIGLLILLPVFHRALMALVWPTQQRLADDIAWLRARGDVTDKTRDLVAFMGRHAFDAFAIVVFCFMLPLALVQSAAKPHGSEGDPLSGYGADVQPVLDRTIHRFMLSIAAVNPLFAVLFAIEFAVAVAFTGVLHLVRVTTVRPVQRAEASLRAALTLYDHNLTRFT
jgi:hypothetical protein